MKHDSTGSVTRRQLLKGMALTMGGAAIGGMVPAFIPNARGQDNNGKPETRSAKLGFIALTDAAPLFVALEKGFFAKHGMTDVQVLKQSSWGTTRDNLVLGSARGGIDGAHILTPMCYLLTLGVNSDPVPMQIVARLNVGGQGISVSNEYRDLNVRLDASELGKALAAKRKSGKDVRAAMTFPGGTHDLWLRYWLGAGGIDPDKDVATIVVPPPQMVANMRVGNMDTFCVGAPWNAQTVSQGIGYNALTTGELWHNHPEKALGLRADYVSANPNATRALIMAVMEAQMYCEQPENIEEVARICSSRRWIHVAYQDLVDRMKGNFNFGNNHVVDNHPARMRFWQDHASYPFQSHDLWFLTENQRWGNLPLTLDTQDVIKRVNREDLWREAAARLGIDAADIPASTSRGVETFFDGKQFDPANPKAYLDSLAIKRVS